MASPNDKVVPRHYFLNERHQLMPREKDGGGRSTKVVGINWESHGANLGTRFVSLRAAQENSSDPSARSRMFVVALPASKLKRTSSAKDAPGGVKEKTVDLAGAESQIVSKLGFDLLSVTKDGAAIVHAPNTKVEQMVKTLARLGELGSRDHDRWAHIQDVSAIPLSFKTSSAWWETIGKETVEAVIDLQPFLTRKESDELGALIKRELSGDEKVKRVGREFSGRIWIVAELMMSSILRLAKTYQSIFSIRPPLYAYVSARKRISNSPVQIPTGRTPADAKTLPCVGVVDTGIPLDHPVLRDYVRGRFNSPFLSPEANDYHGSFVASRVIFGGALDSDGEPENLVGRCSVYDVNVNNGPFKIHAESVDNAIESVASTNRDIRVFNLSFDIRGGFESYEDGRRDQLLRQMADLDNRAFSDDLLFVVAAGNSDAGVPPNPDYPNHSSDHRWALGAWSRCFNALTCGGTADRVNHQSVATESGAPSPFCRVGPGFGGSRKPDLSAHAGNCDSSYQHAPGSGLGVMGCNENGLWEDNFGTSFAAPVLSGNVARLFDFLRDFCADGARPFSCLAKAVVALAAKRSALTSAYKTLADVTLGFGSFDFDDFAVATSAKAAFFWQGLIEDEDSLATVELPLPGAWVRDAGKPMLRLICSWETPVNHAAEHIWACRNVEITLRPKGGFQALRGKGKNSAGYPLLERKYDLKSDANKGVAGNDSCLAEIRYTHVGMAEYPAGFLDFSSQQRVAIAYELFDEANVLEPHSAVQALPVLATLNRLSIKVPASRQAVSIKLQSS